MKEDIQRWGIAHRLILSNTGNWKLLLNCVSTKTGKDHFARNNPLIFIYGCFHLSMRWNNIAEFIEHLDEKFKDYSDIQKIKDPTILFKILFSDYVQIELFGLVFFVYPEFLNPQLISDFANRCTAYNLSYLENLLNYFKDPNVITAFKYDASLIKKLVDQLQKALEYHSDGKPRLPYAVKQENYQPFIDAFYKAFNNPAVCSTKEKEEVETNKLEAEINTALGQCRHLIYLETASMKKMLKDHPLIFLYVAAGQFRMLDLGFGWAKIDYPQKIDRIKDPAILFSMMHACSEMEKFFVIYPELKTPAFLLSPDMVDRCGSFRALYEYYKQTYSSLTTMMKHFVMLGAIKYLNPKTEGQLSNFYELHFLLSEGLSLSDANTTTAKWYHFVSWENLRDQQAFLFDHFADSEKQEVVQYLNNKYPKLVYTHCLVGNFFIAQQFIALGLATPNVNIVEFLCEAIRLGLSNSKEIKKYRAMYLLQCQAGCTLVKEELLSNTNTESSNTIVSCSITASTNPTAVNSNTVVTSPNRDAELFQMVDGQILNLVQHYVNNFSEGHDSNPSQRSTENKFSHETLLTKLNELMLAIERDYALALSTLYDLPVFQNDANQLLRFYRGITLPKSKLNDKLVTHWLNFGHRAGFYTFLGHGFNRDVFEGLATGPRMAWNSQSDITCISPDITVCLTFAGVGNVLSSDRSDHYLINMMPMPGQPWFFGNWVNVGREKREGIPYQLEMPFIEPQGIVEVYQLEQSGNYKARFSVEISLISEPLHTMPTPPNPQTTLLLKGEQINVTPRSSNAISITRQNFVENQKNFKSRSYLEYFRQFNTKDLFNRFTEISIKFCIPDKNEKSLKTRMNYMMQCFTQNNFPRHVSQVVLQFSDLNRGIRRFETSATAVPSANTVMALK